jgi:phage gp29-like protein
MAADAVAIVPEGSDISIMSAGDKRGGSDVHSGYIQMANAEISKAVLGQTLTTEIGDAGSYAAASAHNLIREDIAAADRRRISSAFNRLAAVYTFYNFGPDACRPLFEFVKDEDLQAERAERDVKLYQTGWRPKKDYFIREYGMQEDDFAVQEASESGGFPGFNKKPPENVAAQNACPCGCQGKEKKRTGVKKLFHQFAMLFASKDTKELEKDSELMERFDAMIMKAAQEETNTTVDSFVDALGQAKDFDDAFDITGALYDRTSPAKCAALLDEARYAASQIGAKTGDKGGRRNG